MKRITDEQVDQLITAAQRGHHGGWDARPLLFDLKEARDRVKSLEAALHKLRGLRLRIVTTEAGDGVDHLPLISRIDSVLYGSAEGEPATIWIVGDIETNWHVLGAFATEEDAHARCTSATHFIAPLRVGESIQDDEVEWPGCYYPLARGDKATDRQGRLIEEKSPGEDRVSAGSSGRTGDCGGTGPNDQSSSGSILQEVAAERRRQDEKWGEKNIVNRSPEWTAVVLGEEYGEVCEAIQEFRADLTAGRRQDLRKELVQVAAVAVAGIEALDRMSFIRRDDKARDGD